MKLLYTYMLTLISIHLLSHIKWVVSYGRFDSFVLQNIFRVTIRGDHHDEAVLCTEKATFDLKMADTSNSLLLVPHCVLSKDEGLKS